MKQINGIFRFCMLSCLLLLLLQSIIVSGADLKLHGLFGEHMVLQQQSDVKIWGWAKAKDSVFIKTGWDEKSCFDVAGNDGQWEIVVQTPIYGGPYELIISADTVFHFHNVLIGEVWLCSGQSNMAMPLRGFPGDPVNGAMDEIISGEDAGLRFYTVRWNPSVHPEQDCSGDWAEAESNTIAWFSAVGYFFGKQLRRNLNVPIGLIHSSIGGTPAEAWTDRNTLKTMFPEISLEILNSDSYDWKSPTVLWNGMIHPLSGYAMRGVIWYQGESNVGRADQYKRLFPAMIRSWRKHWNMGDFPFYFVQIAPFEYPEGKSSAYLREAQLQTLSVCHNTGMAIITDLGLMDNIHPPDKENVGKRLAYIALSETYGKKGFDYCGPVYREMEIVGDRIRLYFDHARNGYYLDQGVSGSFTIAADDRSFQQARVEIAKDYIEVWNDGIARPVAVRYCWEDYCEAALYNVFGLPASSFRTDAW